ncbi:enolase-phosphatase E1-like [Toxorhynchites rutilus septentrionalis]|uniref:enolase-phosphatase E1-like n=1 Tax=Toxorhynchites rutilus septentrionalis TaxID=329112 RepID=UPI00247B24D5|nr:enolase-phosphatase E1-like [Toxorhynchites rutilus septentrionalis]
MQQQQQQIDSAPTQGHKQLMRVRSKTCDVRGCPSNSLRNPDLLFVGVPGHCFPERRFVWLTLMQAIRDKKRSYVCSRHFKIPDDFKDFHEFISAPPGYKRQLMVKKGVVPHLNMPPSNNTGLPPLTDKWQMTLPVTLTESHRIKEAASMAAAPTASVLSRFQSTTGTSVRQQGWTQDLPQRKTCMPSNNNRNNDRIQLNKAIQTDSKSDFCGLRVVRPSLQYCRLCLKRHDLEPIFAGDQTLIEPDLIDKIYRNLGIMITAQCDFPSSICSGCYQSVYEFAKFYELVRKHDRSLWVSTSSQGKTNPKNLPVQTSTSVRTKTTALKQPVFRVHNASVPKVIPNISLQQTERQEDSLLVVGHVEDVRTYEQRQKTIERNQPREQRIQDTLIPVPYRRKPMLDPLQNIEEQTDRSVETDAPARGVQMGDRIVPVTFIEAQIDTHDSNSESTEINVSKLEQTSSSGQSAAAGQTEETTVKDEIGDDLGNEPTRQTKSVEPSPDVLQAVKLISKTVLEAASQQRTSSRILGTKSKYSCDNKVSKIWKIIHSDRKKISVENKSLPTNRVVSKVSRGIKFPGTLTTLFSGGKKNVSKQQQQIEATPSKNSEAVKPIKKPEVLKSSVSSQLSETLKVKEPEPKPTDGVQQKLKENDAVSKAVKPIKKPEVLKSSVSSQQSETLKITEPEPKPTDCVQQKLKENDARSKAVPITSPRTARARKIPLKYKDTVGFPMPKIIIVKKESEPPLEQSQRVTEKSKSKPPTSQKSEVPAEVKTPQRIEESVQTPEVIPEERTTRARGRPRKYDQPVEADPKPPPKPIGRPSKRKSDSITSQVELKETITTKLSKVDNLDKNTEQTQSQRQKNPRANGSRKSAPAKISEEKGKETTQNTVVSSQDWKCPFCPDRNFDQKKGLVKHLRKRHGMDYALVRQRLAIYGGNWR